MPKNEDIIFFTKKHQCDFSKMTDIACLVKEGKESLVSNLNIVKSKNIDINIDILVDQNLSPKKLSKFIMPNPPLYIKIKNLFGGE